MELKNITLQETVLCNSGMQSENNMTYEKPLKYGHKIGNFSSQKNVEILKCKWFILGNCLVKYWLTIDYHCASENDFKILVWTWESCRWRLACN